jgi:hypothetical protein
VTSKIHKACRTVGPERIGHDRIKTAGQPKQISELDASFHSEAGPAHERGIRQAENDGDLATWSGSISRKRSPGLSGKFSRTWRPIRTAQARRQVGEKVREMSETQNTGGNLSFVSIRSAPSTQKERDDTKHEDHHVPVIDVEALQSIRRIVLTVKERIAAGQASNPGDGHQRLSAGDPNGSEAVRSNRGEDHDGEKAGKR